MAGDEDVSLRTLKVLSRFAGFVALGFESSLAVTAAGEIVCCCGNCWKYAIAGCVCTSDRAGDGNIAAVGRRECAAVVSCMGATSPCGIGKPWAEQMSAW
jgi:hypothetical protein